MCYKGQEPQEIRKRGTYREPSRPTLDVDLSISNLERSLYSYSPQPSIGWENTFWGICEGLAFCIKSASFEVGEPVGAT